MNVLELISSLVGSMCVLLAILFVFIFFAVGFFKDELIEIIHAIRGDDDESNY